MNQPNLRVNGLPNTAAFWINYVLLVDSIARQTDYNRVNMKEEVLCPKEASSWSRFFSNFNGKIYKLEFW